MYSVLLLLISLTDMLPRVLQRYSKNRTRTRLQTINCRTLLDDIRLDELDDALNKKGIDICALQETRCNGFMKTTTSNFCIFTYGERSGSCIHPQPFQ